jgi:spoIIIJ-associated protein
MKKYIFEGKKIDEAIKKACNELSTNEENLIINTVEEKQKFIKKQVKIEVIEVNEIINYLKDTLKEITNLMNLTINLEVRRRENIINITMFSNNNSILIGKNGRTIQAFQNILRQIVPTKFNEKYKIIIDVENYKEKRIKFIESVAKKIAKEVSMTKVEAKLEAMNSYERRIVHNIVSKNKNVYTESIGEEPNRYVVIKPKEE